MIAKGEKVPKYKLKSEEEDNYYWVDELGVLVYSQSGLPDIFELTNIRYDILNEDVEIIEDTPKEYKKIEKLDYLNSDYYFKNNTYGAISNEEIVLDIKIIENYINKLIDRLNGDSDD